MIASNLNLSSYAGDMSCAWLLSAPSYGRIALAFTLFATEAGSDFVTVFNGSSAAAPQIASLSGSALPAAIRSLGSTAFVTFTSDGAIEASGFRADAGFLCAHGVTTQITTSGALIASSVGLNYPLSLQCFWTVTAPAGSTVRLNFSYFSTETCCVFVTFFNGSSVTAPFLRNINGLKSAGWIENFGQNVTIRFSSTTGTAATFPGFSAIASFIGF